MAPDIPAATNTVAPPPDAKPKPLASPFGSESAAGMSALRLGGKSPTAPTSPSGLTLGNSAPAPAAPAQSTVKVPRLGQGQATV